MDATQSGRSFGQASEQLAPSRGLVRVQQGGDVFENLA